jgi:hypothetical protein
LFIRYKNDKTIRLILNLKRLNDIIDSKHFKMEKM